MARARNIKPGFFKNEILGAADPLYMILFEGLWVLADREGRLENRPLRIKAEVFPYRDGLKVADMLNWLDGNGFITQYEVNGIKYIQVLNFTKHQNPHKNETESEIPSPEIIGTTTEKIGTKSDSPRSARADSLSTDSLSTDSLKAPRFALPPWIDPKAWQEFEEHRKKLRKPMTDRARGLIVAELEKLKPDKPDDVLMQSIRKGWQDVFPLKSNNTGATNGSGKFNVQAASRKKLADALASEAMGDGPPQEVFPALPPEVH